MSESVVLCEGYLDRAFWAGWLERLECKDPGRPTDESAARKRVFDRAGKQVTGGQFAFDSKSEKFVRVVPCRGKDNIWREMDTRLGRRDMRPVLARLVINRDADVPAQSKRKGSSGVTPADLLAHIKKTEPSAELNEQEEIELDEGATKVCLVRWEALDEDAPGLPKKQTLERLVCAAIIAVYPERAPAVHAWLNSRPDPPPADPKEHAWSYMAGWYAAHGCEDFYRAVWRDHEVATALESRLRKSGALRIAEALAE